MLSTRAWIWLVILAVLFLAVHWNFVYRAFRVATGVPRQGLLGTLGAIFQGDFHLNPDWSHTLVIPLISLYFIYQQRHRLAQMTMRVYMPGLMVFFLGLASYAWWIYPGRNDMFQGVSMILALSGLVLFVLGPRAIAVLWFPLIYLLLSVKVSNKIWEQIAWQLQLIAAKTSTILLQVFGGLFMGMDAHVEGSTIALSFTNQAGQYVTEKLNVAEACSGLRMAMAFVALGVAMAFLSERRWWQRLVIVLSTLPIAVAVNVGRVTTLGFVHVIEPGAAQGEFHTFIGMLMLLPAAGMFWLLGWIMDNLFIEDPKAAAAARRKAQDQRTAEQAERQSTDAAPRQSPNIGRILLAVLLGAVLTLGLGLIYASVMTWLRPDLAFESLQGLIAMDQFSASGVAQGAVVLGVVAVGILAVALWAGRRMIGSHRHRWVKPPEIAMALVAGILLTMWVGMSRAIALTETVLMKEPVDMRLAWRHLPDQVDMWTLLSEDPPLPAEQLEALGTDLYISRTYQKQVAAGLGPDQGPVVRLHLAYYTGMVDTVPHVPQRCFVAGGLRALDVESIPVEISGPRIRQRDQRIMATSVLQGGEVLIPQDRIDATVFTFHPPGRPEHTSNVLYFFAANGKFLQTAEGVRLQGFDPRDRYAYYCKIEVMTPGVADPEQAAELVGDFLSSMLPEIMACLPDWEKVKAGYVPRNARAQGQDVAKPASVP